MTGYSSSLSLQNRPRFSWQASWGLAALLTGILIGTGHPLALLSIGIAAYFILALITPTAALISVVVLAPLRTLIATEADWPLSLDIGQILIFCFVAALIITHIARKQIIQIRWSPIYVPLFIFITAAGLSALSALSLGAWLNEWLKWILIFALTVIILLRNSFISWEWLTFGIVIAAAANSLVGLYIFFGGSGADHLLINDRFFRAFGTFGQPNPFGGFMGLAAPLSVMLTTGYAWRVWQQLRQRQQNILSISTVMPAIYGTLSLIILAGLIASWSRGAWLGIVVAFAAVAFAIPRRLWQSILLVTIGGTLALGLYFTGLLPQSMVERISSSTEEYFAFDDVRGVDINSQNYAVVERLAHWQAALSMFRDNPWLGIGLGNFDTAYPEHRLINWNQALGHAHNYYLNILAETGIIGGLAYGGVVMSLLAITWRARHHPDGLARSASIGLLGSWVYLATHSFIDNLYVNNLFLHIGILSGVSSLLYDETHWKLQWRMPDVTGGQSR